MFKKVFSIALALIMALSVLPLTVQAGTVYTVTVDGGSGGGSYAPGDSVTVTADAAPAGQRFRTWWDAQGLTFTDGSAATPTATFTMPARAVTLTAVYESLYTVTVIGGTGGGSFGSGDSVTISADAPPAGQRFKEWTSAGRLPFPDSDKTSPALTFTMTVKEDVTLTATYENVYAVTVLGGSGGGSFAEDDRVAITADTPPAGQRFKAWTGAEGLIFTSGGATAATATFIMPARAVTLTATYEDLFDVTVSGGSGGGKYDVGDSVTVSANAPAAGKRFKAWTGANGLTFTNGSASTATATFTMPARAVALTATYEDLYAVTVNNGMGGGEYGAGDSVTVTAAAPPTGKQFKEWTGADGLTFTNGSANTATATFTMPAHAVTLTATYEDLMTWSDVKTALEAGNNVMLKNDVTRDARESITVTNTAVLDLNGHTLDGGGQPYSGHSIVHVKAGGDLTVTDGSAGGNGNLGNVWGTDAIYVNGDDAEHVGRCTLSGGTVTDGVYIVLYGCFTMTGGTLDGSGVSNNSGAVIMTGGCIKNCGTGVDNQVGGSFTMTGGSVTGCATGIWIDDGDFVLQNVSISGNDVNICYHLTDYTETCYGYSVVAEHGSVTLLEGKPFYAAGDTVTVTDVIPDPFYRFDGVTATDADGREILLEVNRFTAPAGVVTFTATFNEIEIAAAASPAAGGTVAVSKDYDTGCATFTAAPNEGYEFLNWTNNYGHVVSTDAAYSFYPTDSVGLTANFAGAYAVTVNGGTGGGQFACGDSVTVTAAAPPTGKQFKEWTGALGLTFTSGSASTATATFTMPARAVTLTATYEDLPMSWSDVKTALEAGNNVTLKNDVTRDAAEDIVVTKSAVLDLNGHTLDGGGRTYSGYPIVSVKAGGDLTVTDGSAGGNGNLGNVWGTDAIYVNGDDAEHVGRCTLSGGTVTDGVYIVLYGCFTMTGGTLDGSGVSNNSGAVIMTGGCIKNCGTGVYNDLGGSFTMTGGSVTGCTTGINIEDGDFVLQNVSISGNDVNIYYHGTNYTETCYGLSVALEHGSVTLSADKPFFVAGDTVTVTDVIPDPFYCFNGNFRVTDADGRKIASSIDESFEAPTGVMTFTATFNEIEIAAAASPAAGGTVAVSKDYDTGCATVTATANEGYEFLNWTNAYGYVYSTDAVYSFYPDWSIELTAHFTAVTEPLAAENVTLSWSSKVYNGVVQKPTVTIKNAAGDTLTEDTDYTLTWPEEDSILTGVYTITVTGMGGYSGETQKSYAIVDGALTVSSVTRTPISFNYNGEQQQPAVKVTNSFGEVLAEGEDYTVTYPTSIAPGYYLLRVDGINGYSGTIRKAYTIKEEAVSINVTRTPTTFIANGAQQQPTVTVTNGAGDVLTENVDYTVTYPDSMGPGSYMLRVDGLGAYAGQFVRKAYVIKEALTVAGVSRTPITLIADGTQQQPTVTVTNAAGDVLIEGEDYTVTYPESVGPGSYMVRVDGKGCYTGSVRKAYVVKEALTVAGVSRTPVYFTANGDLQQPTVTVTNAAGEPLTEGEDYTVTCPESVDPGTYLLRVTGKGCYTGTVFKAYVIR